MLELTPEPEELPVNANVEYKAISRLVFGGRWS
jgi:hypothetical protein